MTENQYKGKIYSFYELLNDYKIEIPIIQRDYAQGRKDKKEIRDKFLSAIYHSLSNNKEIKLDFIYGNVEKDSFQPLDGQQRLTTLFLLHWYAATKGGIVDFKILNKFSYETRITSRDFCEALTSNRIIIDEEGELSSKIIDSNWFFLSWKKDPTIDAMFRTIDDIHSHFYKIPDLWGKLISDDKLISFYYVELENIGLTDDLYIKMNARGKLLSSFENFKAGFQKHINDNRWESGKSLTNKFAFKIDTVWTDYFWTHFNKGNNIDNAFIRFISSIAMIRLSLEKKDKIEDRFNIIRRLQDDPNSVRPDLLREDDFRYLIECFDIYQSKYSLINSIDFDFPLWQNTPKSNIIKEVIFEDGNVTYTQKVLFFAEIEYLRKVNQIDIEKYKEWIRVIRNIISRGDIERNGNRPQIVRSPQTFAGVINLISELSDGCEDIYNYLVSSNNLKSTFAKDQVEEERLKAVLISENFKRKKSVFDIEDNDLLRGKIEFVLFCMGYDTDSTHFDDELFMKIRNVFITNLKNETNLSNDLRRALLTIECDGRYEYYFYWWSLWYVVYSNKRCLIDSYRELEYYMYSDYRTYLKKLILKLIDSSLKEIALNFEPPSNFPNWKTRLIKEPDLLNDKSKSNYIAIPEDESCCYLLKSMRPRDIEGSIKIE